MSRRPPKLDPASVGISFVDILFGLVVSQVLDPLKNWAEDPTTHPLPLPVTMQLAVVLVLTLTSWIGYHSSSNRPRFRLIFFNWELVKFSLDVSMVVVYFVAASIAARAAPALRAEALLVMIAFGLYLLWDLTGAIERAGINNAYEAEWDRVHQDPNRPDVVESWTPTSWVRIAITALGAGATAVFFAITVLVPALHHPTRAEVVAVDAVAVVALLAYRWAKDFAH